MIEEQAAYFAIHGRYEQRPLVDGVAVDVYESPEGHGFVIRYEKDGMVKCVGHGPEDRSHDWRRDGA